jgi:hypothetical protein
MIISWHPFLADKLGCGTVCIPFNLLEGSILVM